MDFMEQFKGVQKISRMILKYEKGRFLEVWHSQILLEGGDQ